MWGIRLSLFSAFIVHHHKQRHLLHSLDLAGRLHDLALVVEHGVHLVPPDGVHHLPGCRRRLLLLLLTPRRQLAHLLLTQRAQRPLLAPDDLVHLAVQLPHRVVDLALALEYLPQLARRLRVELLVEVVVVVLLGVRVSLLVSESVQETSGRGEWLLCLSGLVAQIRTETDKEDCTSGTEPSRN